MIFKNQQCWYYVPALASKLDDDFDVDAEDEVNNFVVTYGIKQHLTNFSCWLAILLFEFCTPSSIFVKRGGCHGSIGNLAVKILIDLEAQVCQFKLKIKEEE